MEVIDQIVLAVLATLAPTTPDHSDIATAIRGLNSSPPSYDMATAIKMALEERGLHVTDDEVAGALRDHGYWDLVWYMSSHGWECRRPY